MTSEKELDKLAQKVVDELVFTIGLTNVERTYLALKIYKVTVERENLLDK